MKIAHVANWYGPKSGGLRTTIDALANSYVKRGHSILVVVPSDRTETVHSGLKSYCYLRGVRLPFSGGYRVILRKKKVIQTLESFNPVVLEISDRTTLLGVSKWARRKKIHSNFFAHENVQGVLKAFFPWVPGTVKLAKFWNQRTMKLVDSITATTNFAAEEFRSIENFSESKLQMIPLGVDPSEFSVMTQGSQPAVNRYVFACTRLSKEKDPTFLLEIGREMKRRAVDYQMFIAGDGPVRSNFEKVISAEQLPIILLGYINDRKDLNSLMSRALAFLAVGPIETFGLAAVESLASGTPVICRESSALREIIDGECGRALPREAQAWLSAINDFANRNRSEVSHNCSRRAGHFTWDACSESLLTRYKELV
ncbi:MAG: glycosyltransferase [Actinobacteria bacterium]|uniref:Glycosyltransferase n=1 Tax=Candidatus Fonsibacter lacus TaxID=2576439 RepID=A0A965LKV0_9PROT|nr:glycosyltransferase [Candidatus Fonsibacter lacus]